MAKIIEEIIVVKFSRIAKDNDTGEDAVTSTEIQQALEQVAQELVGNAAVVEVQKV